MSSPDYSISITLRNLARKQQMEWEENKGACSDDCLETKIMGNEEVKLYGMWASPFSLRIELALKLKGIQYEYIEEDLHNKSPLLLQYNPIHQKVPVLLHHGNPIPESLVILEYIDETWKHNPLLPQDPYPRAKSRFWAKSVDEKVLFSAWKAMFGDENEKEKALAEFDELVKVLEKELEGKEFFGGDAIGYLDIAVLAIPFWFGRVQEVVGVELVAKHKFPLLFKWCEKLCGIEVFNQCHPSKEKHIAFIRARLDAFKAPKQ